MRKPALATLGALTVLALLLLAADGAPAGQAAKAPPRTFTAASSRSPRFAGMYISPQTASTRHGLVSSPASPRGAAHCGWLTGPGTAADRDGPEPPRVPDRSAAPASPGGGFATPAVIRLWVWADVAMKPGQWVSLATLSSDASDRWSRVVTVNLDPGGWVNVFHVPVQGAHSPQIETHRRFPMRRWVKLTIRIDFDPDHGFISVRQNNQLVARAAVQGGHGRLEQAHFGMYAIPSLTTGRVCNDDLKIVAART